MKFPYFLIIEYKYKLWKHWKNGGNVMSMVVLAYVFCIQLDLYKYNKSLLLSRQGPYK